jgi:hypothetical protein
MWTVQRENIDNFIFAIALTALAIVGLRIDAGASLKTTSPPAFALNHPAMACLPRAENRSDLTKKRTNTDFIYEYSQGGFYEKCDVR